MASAANFAFANRQLISHWTRESFEQVLKVGPKVLQLEVIYDVCHNIAKVETHDVQGEKKKVCVHRKGATRAFLPAISNSPLTTENWDSPCSFPVTWAGIPTCSGYGKSLPRNLWVNLPWSRPAHEQARGQKKGAREINYQGP